MEGHDCEEELKRHVVIFEQFSCDNCGYEAFIRAEKTLGNEEDVI